MALFGTKAIKHDYYSSIIMWTNKNSKGKYWVVSQQALFFNAFLARQDDDNDAHIKDKNWNITIPQHVTKSHSKGTNSGEQTKRLL